MSGFLGADTAALREHAQLLRDRSTAIDDLRAKLEPLVLDESIWTGPDADAFRSRWAASAGDPITANAEDLRRWGDDLEAEAEAQDQTSDDLGGGAPPEGPGGFAEGGGGGGGVSGWGPEPLSLWDKLTMGVGLYNKTQGAIMKAKKAWEVVNMVRRAGDVIRTIDDPLTSLIVQGFHGSKLAAKVFTKPTEAFGKLSATLMGKLGVPTGFGSKNFFGFVDKLAAKAPFLTKAAPFLGKALPALDVVFGIKQAYDGFSSGDTFKGVTGTVSATGGALMLAGGALSATGIGAVVGGPLIAAGAILSGGAAIADLGKAVYDNWPKITQTASDAWNATTSFVSDVGSKAKDVVQDIGGKVADGISGAFHSVFG